MFRKRKPKMMWRTLKKSLKELRHVTLLPQRNCFINKIPERTESGQACYEDQERLITHVLAAVQADAFLDSDSHPPLR